MKNRNHRITMVLLTLGVLVLPPMAEALSPPPDGGYPGQNTAEGTSALLHLNGGTYNTAVGWSSLGFNIAGNFNTAVGAGALLNNASDWNTATGAGALLNNVGYNNTASGAFALFSDTNGVNNTALGASALFQNTHGNANTAVGIHALTSNTIGSTNAAVGDNALEDNTTGNGNEAFGTMALGSNTTGDYNVAIGDLAGSNLTTGNNNIDIGYNVVGVAGESNSIRVGNADITDTFIRGISGATVSGGAAVFVNGNGKLGTMTSSSRFKEDVKPIGEASEALFSLNPVAFRYKKEIDPESIPQFGLIAEDVEKVDPDLVICDAEGRPQTVRYEQVNAMLLNEFLREHRTVKQQQKEIEALRAELKEQCALIQHVNDTIEFSNSIPQIVASRP